MKHALVKPALAAAAVVVAEIAVEIAEIVVAVRSRTAANHKFLRNAKPSSGKLRVLFLFNPSLFVF